MYTIDSRKTLSIQDIPVVTFTCRQCGTCCLFFGDNIVIEREIGPFEFQCMAVSTGTLFTGGSMMISGISSLTPRR